MAGMLFANTRRFWSAYQAWVYSVLFHVIVVVLVALSLSTPGLVEKAPTTLPTIKAHIVSLPSPTVSSSMSVELPEPTQPKSVASSEMATEPVREPGQRVEKKQSAPVDDELSAFDAGLASASKKINSQALALKPTAVTYETKKTPKPHSVVAKNPEKSALQKVFEQIQEKVKKERERHQLSDKTALGSLPEEKIVIDPLILYQQKIAKKLRSYINVTTAFKGRHCLLRMSLSRDGTILNAIPDNGYDALCDEARQAARRIHKMPMPDDPGLYKYLKKLRITVRAEGA